MPRTIRIQTQFNSGELSPEMYGRTDLGQYRESVRTMENFVPLRAGPARRRPGMRFIAEAANQANPSRLIPFQFSVEQAYVLEFAGDGTIRFYADQGQVVFDRDITNGAFTSDIAGWSNTSAGTGTISHDADNGRLNLAGGGGGNEARAEQSIANLGVATYTLSVDVLGGSVTAKVGTSSGASDIASGALSIGVGRTLAFTPVVNGTVYITFENAVAATHQIDNVALDEPVYEIDHPYAAGDLTDVQFAQQEDVLYLAHGQNKPRKITRSGHANWTLASYAPTADPFTGTDDYPAAVTLFEERIVWAGTNNNPNRIYVSKQGDLSDMTVGTNDDDGFEATLAGPQNNIIRWVIGAEDLIVGTSGAEWATRRGAAFTPTGRTIRQRAQNGVARLQPVAASGRIFYPRRFGDPINRGRVLGALQYEFESDGLVPLELTILSRHITGPSTPAGPAGITAMGWQQEPDRVLWLARADGALLSFTYDAQESVAGWARHPTDGVIESLTVVPGADRDEVWLAVRRIVDGFSVRYIELLDPTLNTDAALTGSAGTPTLTWSGLGHLEGKSVAVVADGAPVGTFAVSAGQFTLANTASAVEAGLFYQSKLQPNDSVDGFGESAALSRDKSNWQIAMLLDNTVGIKIDGREVTFREVIDPTDTPIPNFSGYKLAMTEGWSRTGRFTITQDVPMPCTILAFVAQQDVES
ncbi:MAG: hypothetical protein HQ495_04435 [Alphaproteobacteria bacterium]|nr:hypothetical protein [Alphaproteobacteria bacterium]